MANKYLSRRFTTREIVLFVVLLVAIVIGLYFGLVYYPIQSRTEQLNEQRETLQQQRAVAETKKALYDDMKEALEEIKAGDEPATEMPLYDSGKQYQVLRDRFTSIFDGIDFRPVYSVTGPENGIYTRTVNLTFNVNEGNKGDASTVYEKTRKVLYDLLHTGFRCQMTSLTFTPGDGDLYNGSVSVSTTIVFYERA